MKDFKRAKAPKTPMAGPYGHPIHPLLVTVFSKTDNQAWTQAFMQNLR